MAEAFFREGLEDLTEAENIFGYFQMRFPPFFLFSLYFFLSPLSVISQNIWMNQASPIYKQHKLVNMLFRALHSCDPGDKMLFCTHAHTNTWTLMQHTASHLNA